MAVCLEVAANVTGSPCALALVHKPAGGRRLPMNALMIRPVMLSMRNTKANVICRSFTLGLIAALITPPQVNTMVFPTEAEVPALEGNLSMARDVAIGRAMVVPAVQIIIGSKTVIGESPNQYESSSMTSPEKEIRLRPTTI